ncbi:MAG: DUF2235 domain-containing protein [Desulfovibrionaceae bacterium]|nr:DUF2235 domain-containing protein [Desulfovibrionaceae bacterium]
MATSIDHYAAPEEVKRLAAAPELAAQLNTCAIKKPFVFFAGFDGTNNDKNNLALSGSPYQTNIGNLYDMAKKKMDDDPAHFQSRYYPGVGTGGEHGNRWNAGPAPTVPLRAIASQAYDDFAYEAYRYLQSTPGAKVEDLSAVTAGFSRGNAAQVMFARMIDEQGLKLRDGTVVAPPHTVPISGMVMIDPVYTNVQGDLSLPGNVHGDVLAWGAEDELRALFKRADYANDERVKLLQVPGNHCGLGGGYDQHGSAAAVLEGSVNYLRNSGIDLGPVPPQLRFDPARPVPVYSEVQQITRGNDYPPVVEYNEPVAGAPGQRATRPVPAPSGVEPRYAQGCEAPRQYGSGVVTSNSSVKEMFYALTDAVQRNDVQGMKQATQAFRDSPQGQAELELGRQILQRREQERAAQQQQGQPPAEPEMHISH